MERTAPTGSAVYIVCRFDVRDPIRGQFDLPGAYRFWCTGNTLHATSLTAKRESTLTTGSTVTYISDSATGIVRPKEAMPPDLRFELRTGQAKLLKFVSESPRHSLIGAPDAVQGCSPSSPGPGAQGCTVTLINSMISTCNVDSQESFVSWKTRCAVDAV